MTIRMLQAWNGLHQQKIVTTLSGSDEAALVAAGIATYDLDGPAENLRMAQLETDAAGNVTSIGGARLAPVVSSIAELRALAAGKYEAVQVLGYYAAGDGGGGVFRWNGSSSAADNGGTVIVPDSASGAGRWMRDYQILTIKMFGAKGDGIADDTVAFNAARAQAIADKRTLHIVGTPLISSALFITARESWFFEGAVGNSNGGLPGSYLIKAASLNADLVTMVAEGVLIENGGILGQGSAKGAGGCGYAIKGNGCVLRNPYVAWMKSHGISIGDPSVGTNANNWDIYHPVLIKNGGDGIIVDDATVAATVGASSIAAGNMYAITTVGTTDFTLIGASSNTVGVIFKATAAGTGTGTATQQTPNANAGTLTGAFAQQNDGNGLSLKRCFVNSIVNPTMELNGQMGVRIYQGSLQNMFLGGDCAEGNTVVDIQIESDAVDTLIYGTTAGYINDSGTNTRVFDKKYAGTIPAPFNPVLKFGGNTTGIVQSTTYGVKTKIGEYWHVDIVIVLSSKGSATGIAQITGLPKAANLVFNPAVSFSSCVNMTGMTGAVMGQLATNTGTINLHQSAATGMSNLTDAQFTNTSNLQLSVVYK